MPLWFPLELEPWKLWCSHLIWLSWYKYGQQHQWKQYVYVLLACWKVNYRIIYKVVRMMNWLTRLHSTLSIVWRNIWYRHTYILGIGSNPVFRRLVNMLTDLFILFTVVAVSYGTGQDQTQNTFTTDLTR
jgi:hypothetical protein